MGESYYVIDKLTELNNETYLNLNYHDYILNNPNSNFMMIDFRRFKEINDTFGHEIGDQYLIHFSRVLKSVFFSSIVVRLHGDEFVVVTKFSLKEILRRIDLCIYRIKLLVEAEILPDVFRFNIGIADAESDLKTTREKADYMMYYAKKNNQYVQTFDEDLWLKKLNHDEFLNEVLNDIKKDKFTYFQRHIHSIKTYKALISEISTRNRLGDSIINKDNYNELRDNAHLKKIDIYNLDFLFTRITGLINGSVLINLDYKSLLTKKDLIDELKFMINVHGIKSNNIIFNININDINSELYNEIIMIVNELKKIGFKICIDKYDNKIADFIWENTDVDYIKLDCCYWKNAMNNEKSLKLLISKLKVFVEFSELIPIFSCVETIDEFNFIKENFGKIFKDILVSGNYISDENKIKIK